MPKTPVFHTVDITKLVHGGQGLGQLENGQKAFVWNSLPGEKVTFRVTKKRKDFIEGIATDILDRSNDRVNPRDELYLSTSPWQIMAEGVEDEYKLDILQETFQRAGVEFGGTIDYRATENFWNYRNKMEYSFYGDENGLHLALYNRGTHAKQIVGGSSIARPEIDQTAQKVVSVLSELQIRAGDLKTLILRCNQQGQVVAALFVKNEKFPHLKELADLCRGLVVVYSNPKSPASVRTKDLYQFGDISLSDTVAGSIVQYDVFSFFQVNVPVFEQALLSIRTMVNHDPVVDLYSGVGAIGVSVPTTEKIVEVDDQNVAWAKINAANKPSIKVIHAPSEKALEAIDPDHAVIVDPPRAGLHAELVEKINSEKPPKVIYLSCNPSTQARDIVRLQANYNLEKVAMYNFFPRTPHIESLALLVRQ